MSEKQWLKDWIGAKDTVWEGPPPKEPGWYPVLLCWDPVEGLIPSGARWDGSKWLREDGQLGHEISGYHPKVCASYEEAEKLAYEHDPDQ